MEPRPSRFLRSSIFRKQVIAITGLIIVGFIFVHLAGNLMVYAGPETYNHYSEMLLSMGELLWLIRIVLITAAVVHVVLTLQLALENYRARGTRYAAYEPVGDRSFATKTMKYTGILIFLFLFIHLYDFTFADKAGDESVVTGLNEGESLHLYGLVWNAFNNPLRALFYVLVMVAVGLHMAHGVESLFQTLGFNHDRYTPWLRKISVVIGVVVAVGFITIPLYVLFFPKPLGM